MPVEDITVDRYYTAQAATSRAVTTALAALWSRNMTPQDISGGWASIKDQAAANVFAGQVRSAAIPVLFLERVLAADDLEPAATDAVSAVAFAGTTASGLDVTTSLESSVIVAKHGIAGGLTPEASLLQGLARLTLLGATQVQDAGRGAMQAAMLLEPNIGGYVRRVRNPSCGRCLIQAGKFFEKSAGFLRHPRCNCVHVPATGRADRFRQDSPHELFSAMTTEQQDKALGPANAKAVREGADLGQVVNARSGMRSAGDNFTTTGTTKRGGFGRAQVAAGTKRRRLTPQGIAHLAGDEPATYRRLLAENGYL